MPTETMSSTSVTPFSSRARDRAFFGVVVGIIRQVQVQLSEREDAWEFDITKIWVNELMEKIRDVVRNRVELIEDTKTADDTIEYLDKIIEDWNQISTQQQLKLFYHWIAQ